MYQFGPTEMRTLKVAVVEELVENSSMTEEEAQAWGRALTFHHQWMVMSREHAAALVHHTREIMMVRQAPQKRGQGKARLCYARPQLSRHHCKTECW